MLNAFCWLPRVNPKRGGPFGPFLGENAFCLAYSGNGLSIIRRYFLLIPGHTVVASP
jgi:hypothetical protein